MRSEIVLQDIRVVRSRFGEVFRFPEDLELKRRIYFVYRQYRSPKKDFDVCIKNYEEKAIKLASNKTLFGTCIQ